MIAEDSNQTYCNSISPFGSHSICIWIRITTSGSSVGGTIRRSAAPSGGKFGAGRPGAATTAASKCCRTRSSDWWSWSWAGGTLSPTWPTSTGAAPMMWSSTRARRGILPTWMYSPCWMGSRSLSAGWRSPTGTCGRSSACASAVCDTDFPRN